MIKTEDHATKLPNHFSWRSWHVLLIVLTYVATRFGYYLLGVRFASHETEYFWQFLDLDLLRHQLLKSVLYLHAQPPLMNLFYGLCMKLFPAAWPRVIHSVYCFLGVFAWLAIYRVIISNGVPRGISLVFVLAAMASPAAALYEAEALYTHIVFCLAVFSAFFFDRYLAERDAGSAIAMLACMTVLVMWRSSYQALWFVAMAAWLIYLTPRRQLYRVGAVAALCLALIGSIYVKNGLMFGSFNSSSWMGMSMAKAWTSTPTQREKNQTLIQSVHKLVMQKKLSPISDIMTYSPVEQYKDIVPAAPLTGVEAADATVHHNGKVNFNNTNYVAISKAYAKDYSHVWRYKPLTLIHFSIQGWFDYLKPTSQCVYMFNEPNEQAAEPVDRVYRAVFCWRWMPFARVTGGTESSGPGLGHLMRALCWPSVFATLLLLATLISPRLLVLASQGLRERRLLLLFLIGNLFYTAVVGNLLEEGENMRFRFETHGLFLMAIAIVLCGLVKAFRAKTTHTLVETATASFS